MGKIPKPPPGERTYIAREFPRAGEGEGRDSSVIRRNNRWNGVVDKARAGKKNHGTNHIVPSWRGPHVTGEGTFHHPRLRHQRASAHTSTVPSPSIPTPALSFSATTCTPISATPPQLTKKGNQPETPPQAPPPLHHDGEIKPNLEPQNPSWIHKSPIQLVGMIL